MFELFVPDLEPDQSYNLQISIKNFSRKMMVTSKVKTGHWLSSPCLPVPGKSVG